MKKQRRERRIRELERLMYQFRGVPSIARRYADEYNKLVEERKKAEDEQREYIEKKRREEGEENPKPLYLLFLGDKVMARDLKWLVEELAEEAGTSMEDSEAIFKRFYDDFMMFSFEPIEGLEPKLLVMHYSKPCTTSNFDIHLPSFWNCWSFAKFLSDRDVVKGYHDDALGKPEPEKKYIHFSNEWQSEFERYFSHLS